MAFSRQLPRAAGALRLGGSFLFSCALAAVLFGLGFRAAALGVGLGFALTLANAIFLTWTLAVLVGREAPERAALAAAASSVGRLLLIGLALWLVVSRLGRETFFGAAGGLLVSQISLFIRGSDAEGGA